MKSVRPEKSGASSRPARLYLLLLTAAIAFFTPQASGTGAKEPFEGGWDIRQVTRLNGSSHLTISAHGYKNRHENEGYTAIIAAPSWNLELFSHNAPLCYQSPMDKFMHDWGSHFRQVSNSAIDVDLSNPWINGKPVTFLGEKATLYKVKARRKWGRPGERVILVMADDIEVHASVAGFLSTYYGYKFSKKLPLRISEIYEGKNHLVVETKSLKRVKVPLTAYKIPRGMRSARSPFEIFMGGDSNAIFGDMVENLGKRPRK